MIPADDMSPQCDPQKWSTTNHHKLDGGNLRIRMETYLAVIYCEVKMMQRVMCRPIYDIFKCMTRDHVRIVDLEYNRLSGTGICSSNRTEHTNMVQKLTKTNRPRNKMRCRGKIKMKRWYGTDWRYPSTGWKACDAKGVGTADIRISLLVYRADGTVWLTDPLVMGLVKRFVKHGVVQDSVHPVNAIIRKQ